MIHIQNLSLSFGSKPILKDLNIQIEEGGFYAIMGANGCGKTTMLKCIANLLKPSKGSVSIEGTDVRQFSARELAQRIAFVRQYAQPDFEFSAFETVLMGRNPYQRHLQNESQKDWDIVERCLRQTNTWHLRFALPSEMSGGELQRVMIARALAQETPILLLDEPTSNLDIAHQFEIMELLKSIGNEQHKTILIVIHDLNLALQYCPQAILLNKGELLFQGATTEALSPENIENAFHVHSHLERGFLTFKGIDDDYN